MGIKKHSKKNTPPKNLRALPFCFYTGPLVGVEQEEVGRVGSDPFTFSPLGRLFLTQVTGLLFWVPFSFSAKWALGWAWSTVAVTATVKASRPVNIRHNYIHIRVEL